MGRVRFLFGISLGAAAIFACNALTGAGDLTVCSGAACADAPSTDGAVHVPTADGMVANGDADVSGGEAGNVECSGGPPTCDGRTMVACVSGSVVRTPCAEACVDGACARFPSCAADTLKCGAASGSCCETLPVPGGTFHRANDTGDAKMVATVSGFALDRYEVTVARFRAFVASGAGTAASPPAVGAGANPKIPNSGWQATWNSFLATDTGDLKGDLQGSTWTDTPGPYELRPVGNVGWFEAFAFCAWDGGRLPTYAEWDFAVVGGDEQRVYPWSVPPTSEMIDPTHAAYACLFASPGYTCPPAKCSNPVFTGPCDVALCTDAGATCVAPPCYGCDAVDIAPAGGATAGAGRWGQFDLAGNFAEILLDAKSKRSQIELPSPCTDCAILMGAYPHKNPDMGGPPDDFEYFVAGGTWGDGTDLLKGGYWYRARYDSRNDSAGFRCARSLAN